jgi:hypothetical protein
MTDDGTTVSTDKEKACDENNTIHEKKLLACRGKRTSRKSSS